LGTSSSAANRATLVATVTTLPDGGLASLAASGLAGVEWLEVRGDLVGDLDPAGRRRRQLRRLARAAQAAAHRRGGRL
jgi:hypothetical protein